MRRAAVWAAIALLTRRGWLVYGVFLVATIGAALGAMAVAGL